MRYLYNILAAIVTVISISFSCDAQKSTTYYKYVKSINLSNNAVNTSNGQQGQFITRDGDACYESDKYGNSVGNGSLKRTARNGNTVKYVGCSYYGSNSHFTFFDDNGVLNIEAMNHVFVYKVSTPPQGVTTSSFISQGSSDYVAPVPTPTNNYNYGGNSNSNSSNSYNRGSATTVYDPCPRCSHSGRCPTCNGSGKVLAFGNKHAETCSTCHGSGTCPTCHGAGKKGSVEK